MVMPSQKLLIKINSSRRVSLCICFDLKNIQISQQSFVSSCDHPTSLGNSISALQLTITLDSVYSDFYHSMFSLGVPSENAEPSNNQSAENMDQESKFLFGRVYQEVSNLPYYLLFSGDFNFTNLE